jgi:hypothetical protein
MRQSESFDEAKLDQWLVRLRRGLLAELRMDATLPMIDVAARALDEAASKPRRSARRRDHRQWSKSRNWYSSGDVAKVR